jgi:hypothetical protein
MIGINNSSPIEDHTTRALAVTAKVHAVKEKCCLLNFAYRLTKTLLCMYVTVLLDSRCWIQNIVVDFVFLHVFIVNIILGFINDLIARHTPFCFLSL